MNLEKLLRTKCIEFKNNTLIVNSCVGYSIMSEILYNFTYDVIFKDRFHSKLIPIVKKIVFKKPLFKRNDVFYLPEKFRQKVLVYPINKEQYSKISIDFNLEQNISEDDIDKICLNCSLIDFGFESFEANTNREEYKKMYEDVMKETYEPEKYIVISFEEYMKNYYSETIALYNTK
jgi:hypothetical protein